MIKMLYTVKEKNPVKKCTNCVHYPNCNVSLEIEKLEKYFDTKNCRQHRYTPPLKQFKSENEELNDKIIALIEEYESNCPISKLS